MEEYKKKPYCGIQSIPGRILVIALCCVSFILPLPVFAWFSMDDVWEATGLKKSKPNTDDGSTPKVQPDKEPEPEPSIEQPGLPTQPQTHYFNFERSEDDVSPDQDTSSAAPEEKFATFANDDVAKDTELVMTNLVVHSSDDLDEDTEADISTAWPDISVSIDFFKLNEAIIPEEFILPGDSGQCAANQSPINQNAAPIIGFTPAVSEAVPEAAPEQTGQIDLYTGGLSKTQLPSQSARVQKHQRFCS